MSDKSKKSRLDIVSYMAGNHVAANLLMLFFIAGGVWVAMDIKQEVFPAHESGAISFRMSYPGSTPEEVEEGILFPAEEAVRGLEVVKRIESSATEGSGRMSIELTDGVNESRALQEVKNAIDRVSSFPDDTERYQIGLAVRQRSTMDIAIAGDLDEATLYDFAERTRNELLALPEVTVVQLNGSRDPEIRIEVPQATLRSLGITLDDIAKEIRRAAKDVPGGEVRTSGGGLLLRGAGRRTYASEYADIEIVSNNDGTRVSLGEIADIHDGFEDSDRWRRFNGQRSMTLAVFQTEEQKPLDISRVVTGFVEEKQGRLPDTVSMTILSDRTEIYKDRLKLLFNNGLIGLLLVLLVLGLFLDPKLAFWVSMGIPVAIIGSLMLLPGWDITINMISLFAFIVTLGMVVDDAVIVGENVFRKMQEGMSATRAAIEGGREMVVPVVFAVATNIIAFIPLMFVPGETGKFFAAIPLVVIAVFFISLIECLFVLPAHLAHAGLDHQKGNVLLAPIRWVQRHTSAAFDGFTNYVFAPLLRITLSERYLASAIFIGALMLMGAWFASGRINFRFRPSVEATRVDAEAMVPFGSPFSKVTAVTDQIEAAGKRAIERLGGMKFVEGYTSEAGGRGGPNSIEVNFDLVADTERSFSAAQFTETWREEVGDIAGLESLFFEYEIGPGGAAALTVELSHADRKTLELAATELANTLESYNGITDVDDGFAAGKPQIDLTLTPEGRSLGLSLESLGKQIRHAYYGAEALRQQRNRDEVKVMVRLPESERRSLSDLENMIIHGPPPKNAEIPLAQAAKLHFGRAYTSINRVDGQRVLKITANVVPKVANANKVKEDLEAGPLPELMANHPGLSYRFGGRQRSQNEAMASLTNGLILSLIGIFAALAALFRSYIQGFIVMTCVPFAVSSALLGHVLMGYDLSVVSVFGIIATCGVVVNGGLVLTVTMNEMVKGGMPFREAVFESGRRRFRPIMLTSLTTFFGLAPMIFETSTQARFLVPMAIALGFGILFSSVIVLLFTPALHMIAHDVKRGLQMLHLIEPLPETQTV